MKHVLLWMLLVQSMSAQAQVWYQKPTGNIGPAMSVVVNAQGVIFASVYNKGIYRSLDSGTTWSQTAPYTDGVWSMAARSNGEIVAALWSRGVYRSTDQGNSWTQVPGSILHADIRAINALNEIVIESEGVLHRSTNNGSDWIQSAVGGTSVTVAGDTMFAAKGTSVYRSTDNGKNWSALTSLSSSSYALLTGQNGTVFAGTYYHDSASVPSIHAYDTPTQTWKNAGPRSTVNALLRRNDGFLFAASHDSGCYYSMDLGAEWKQHNNGLSTSKIYSLALLNDTTIVAGTLDGIFFINSRLGVPLPVELVSFTAAVRNSTVEIRWSTATEMNNHGFEVQRKFGTQRTSSTPTPEEWRTLGFVDGAGTSNAPRDYHFTDRPNESGTYHYRLKQIDRDGKIHYSNSIEVTAVIAPLKFLLHQNFPNPFNPSTTIIYSIPSSGHVSLRVYDLLGREVMQAVNETKVPGEYSVTISAGALSSGTYIYQLRTGRSTTAKTMLLLR